MAKKLSIRLDETFPGHNQKKFNCPSCNKKRFVQFFDFINSEYLPVQFGRCDRQERCGYFLSPYSETSEFVPNPERIEVPENPIVYVDKSIVSQTLSSYQSNTFVQFLISKIGEQRAMEIVYKFYIGTAKNNGTIFWQIDQFKKARTAAKIHYQPNGHRDKQIDVKRLFQVHDGYKPCLFGEHQLNDIDSTYLIGVVESEKSAIICEAYLNSLKNRKIAWFACSGSNGLSFDKIQCLRGKELLLCPDFSFHARATWGLLPMRKKMKPNKEGKLTLQIDEDGDIVDYESAKDRLISIGCKVNFFDPYPEIKDGSDIADYLIDEEPEPEPPKLTMPDLSKLKLIENKKFKHDFKSLITGRHNFVFINGKAQMNNIVLQDKLNSYFVENPMLSKLISKFDLIGGSISPY